VLDPERVRFVPDRDQTDVIAVDDDHAGVLGNERIEEALPHAHGVISAETLEVRSHHDGPELGHPGGIRKAARSKTPSH